MRIILKKTLIFQDKQGRGVLWDIWPDSLYDILCDFALAEKNYSETNFEPVKNKMMERKEDKVLFIRILIVHYILI